MRGGNSYGAFATQYFILFNDKVAGTITAEGRQLTKTMSIKNEEYWYERWHKDTDLHKRLKIKNVNKIDDSKSVSVYGDSICGDSKIITDEGEFTIEELYNKFNSNSVRADKEVIPADFKSLNWTEDNQLHYSNVKNIIRHRSSKAKWKLKAGGKEIIVTDDHSLIVFRSGKKMEVKPSEVKKSDKILVCAEKLNRFTLEIIELLKDKGFSHGHSITRNQRNDINYDGELKPHHMQTITDRNGDVDVEFNLFPKSVTSSKVINRNKSALRDWHGRPLTKVALNQVKKIKIINKELATEVDFITDRHQISLSESEFKDNFTRDLKLNKALGKIKKPKGIFEGSLVEIESIEPIGHFENEYVYDLEMEDESHTFIANNILVHNTDSIFVGFKPAIDSCDWKNQLFNEEALSKINVKFKILYDEKSTTFGGDYGMDIDNPNFLGFITPNDITGDIGCDILLADGSFVKDYKVNSKIQEIGFEDRIFYNWSDELQFIHALDKFRIADYFKECLDEHANEYGVKNIEDFELEKISESIINLEKKKYIQHIVWEDGIHYDRLKYFQPKGVELVRSSTPVFARDRDKGIPKLIEYLFSNPDSFNIKELLKIVKEMRREFELAEVDDISMQSSCSKYEEKVIDDKEKLSFVSGSHFAVKAAAFHNFLLHKEKGLQNKYAFLKSGDKIKYYYCNSTVNKIFAYKRGEYPIEFAPEVDYDVQFEKAILSPINSIVAKLGLPEISRRLSVVMDIFGSI